MAKRNLTDELVDVRQELTANPEKYLAKGRTLEKAQFVAIGYKYGGGLFLVDLGWPFTTNIVIHHSHSVEAILDTIRASARFFDTELTEREVTVRDGAEMHKATRFMAASTAQNTLTLSRAFCVDIWTVKKSGSITYYFQLGETQEEKFRPFKTSKQPT